tara:strand:- start:342 stop:581 length:240 start_codon:yes stop_codon:yes gene_type:complete
MSSPLLEIVELEDGEFVLRRANDDSKPLLSIRFSDDSIEELNEGRFEIVKAMIEAGMDAAGDIAEQKSQPKEAETHILH